MGRRAVLSLLLMTLFAGPAAALRLDFDTLAPLSDVARAELPGVVLSPALVVDEASAADLTGFPSAGWATSGASGLLNTLAPEIVFRFATPISLFEVDVLGLPAGGGVFQGVLAEARRGGTLVDLAFSDVDRVGDSGFHEDRLFLAGSRIDEVSLFPASPLSCSAGRVCFDVGPSSSVFLDSVRFEPVPEPGTALLVLAGISALAARGRR